MNLNLPLAEWELGVKIPFLPQQASTFAKEIDTLYFVLWALTLIFSAIVGFLILFFVIRYKKGSNVSRANLVHTSHSLELAWSIIPLFLGLIIFAWGAKLYADVYKVPSNAKEVFVIGKQWMWHLQHSNGIRENNELHVPIGQPVKLTMISQDTIHSFFVPDFRIKRDVLPGRYTTVWFQATKPGRYHLFCAEYCGMQHSLMGGWVYVMEPKDFEKWQNSNGQKPGDATMNTPTARQSLSEQGAEIYQSVGCANCHAPQDNRRGPSLYAIYGKKRQFVDGRTEIADRAYIRESILKPGEKITAGYENIMPVYDGQLTEEQVNALIAYIKSLGTTNEPKMPGSELDNNGKPISTDGGKSNMGGTPGATTGPNSGNTRGTDSTASPNTKNSADTQSIQGDVRGTSPGSNSSGTMSR